MTWLFQFKDICPDPVRREPWAESNGLYTAAINFPDVCPGITNPLSQQTASDAKTRLDDQSCHQWATVEFCRRAVGRGCLVALCAWSATRRRMSKDTYVRPWARWVASYMAVPRPASPGQCSVLDDKDAKVSCEAEDRHRSRRSPRCRRFCVTDPVIFPICCACQRMASCCASAKKCRLYWLIQRKLHLLNSRER